MTGTGADAFESHRAHLLGVGYRITGSLTDAEDAAQEAWLRLTRSRRRSRSVTCADG